MVTFGDRILTDLLYCVNIQLRLILIISVSRMNLEKYKMEKYKT